MKYMVVTLEVSQLDMSALKFFEFWKREPMSVMAETHQSAMGPYVAMAKAAFESNSVTAVFREPLLVKVWVQAPVGEVEGGGGEGDGGGGEGDGGGGEGEGGGGEGDGGGGEGDGGGGDGLGESGGLPRTDGDGDGCGGDGEGQ